MTDDETGEAISKANLRYATESFYRADPADYLESRLEMLVLLGAKPSEVSDLFRGGLEYQGLVFGPSDPQADTDPSIADGSKSPSPELERYLLLESQLLLHHACETALRLFLVFASGSDTPWVELNVNRSHAAFKRRVKHEFVDALPARKTIGFVCFGYSERPADIEESDWNASLDATERFLRAFARVLLDDAPIYNAMKHGMGIAPGNAVLLVDGHQFGGGPSLEYPESTGWRDDGTREWSLTTRWVDQKHGLSLTCAAVRFIQSMWELGQYRHDCGPAPKRIWNPGGLSPIDLRSPTYGAKTWTWRLAEEFDPERVKPPH
ncbi:MAG: hypothetical protein QOK28_3730 [Actinomycetota bacterium]